MKVPIDTLNVNVVDTRSGAPALIFLHYWGGSARTWQAVIERLEYSSARAGIFAKRMNATVQSVASSHCPFVSHPETAAEIIASATDLLSE